MVDHPHDSSCFCHRIVRATGEIGLFISDDGNEKSRKLLADGVHLDGNRVDLTRHRFSEFDVPVLSQRPLARLLAEQDSLPNRVETAPYRPTPGIVAGMDISYQSDEHAVGALVFLDTRNGDIVWLTTVRRKVEFPYIPGFLAYRELPFHLELMEQARTANFWPDILFVDGNGLLHPRGAGIATHLGVEANVRTIGIGKKLLCGTVNIDAVTVEQPQPVVHRDQTIGMACRGKNHFRPFFVSPGHQINVADAVRVAMLMCRGHRLPEPIFHADRVSREVAKTQTSKMDPT